MDNYPFDTPSEESVRIQVADKLGGVITISYFPAIIDKWMVDQVLDEASFKLGKLIAEELNKNEGKEL